MTSGELLADLIDWAAARTWYLPAEAVFRWGLTPEGRELGGRIRGGINLPAPSILDPDPRQYPDPRVDEQPASEPFVDKHAPTGASVAWALLMLGLFAAVAVVVLVVRLTGA
jgi:hypothetical protein